MSDNFKVGDTFSPRRKTWGGAERMTLPTSLTARVMTVNGTEWVSMDDFEKLEWAYEAAEKVCEAGVLLVPDLDEDFYTDSMFLDALAAWQATKETP